MSASANPDIITKGLVFGFDTGYPLVSKSHQSYRYNRGEPTTTFDVGTMVPTNPNTFFSSNSTYHSNLHGTVWDWSYYPNSNISSDGGMEWIPNYEGPTFIGAWKMKKRAGGNSESNFSGTPPSTIDQNKDYTVSVWCKTDQASMARIHLNTTKDGSSYWGYASGYHSGGGDWERLTLTIPAGAGNTSINTIRCQCLGTSVNADAYWRDYQVEQRSHATPFILGGTRSATGSLLDLVGTTNIDLSNVSFDSNAQMVFDGTDDHIELTSNGFGEFNFQTWTVESWVKFDTITGDHVIFSYDYTSHSQPYYSTHLRTNGVGKLFLMWNDGTQYTFLSTSNNAVSSGQWYHLVGVYESGRQQIFLNGESLVSSTRTGTITFYNQEVWIGRANYGGYLDGDIKVLRHYNKALTAAEVLQNYNATKSRFGL